MATRPTTVAGRLAARKFIRPVNEEERKAVKKAHRDRWIAQHPEKNRWHKRQHKLRSKYGIDIGIYEAMFAAQDGLCAVCRLPERATARGVARALAVDHNHTTGRVRALLCHRCNKSLGLLEENANRAEALSRYIRKWE